METETGVEECIKQRNAIGSNRCSLISRNNSESDSMMSGQLHNLISCGRGPPSMLPSNSCECDKGTVTESNVHRMR